MTDLRPLDEMNLEELAAVLRRRGIDPEELLRWICESERALLSGELSWRKKIGVPDQIARDRQMSRDEQMDRILGFRIRHGGPGIDRERLKRIGSPDPFQTGLTPAHHLKWILSIPHTVFSPRVLGQVFQARTRSDYPKGVVGFEANSAWKRFLLGFGKALLPHPNSGGKLHDKFTRLAELDLKVRALVAEGIKKTDARIRIALEAGAKIEVTDEQVRVKADAPLRRLQHQLTAGRIQPDEYNRQRKQVWSDAKESVRSQLERNAGDSLRKDIERARKRFPTAFQTDP